MVLIRATFEVADFAPSDWVPEITTALPTGQAVIVKTYAGDVEGRSIAQFSGAFDPASGTGTYIAMESFEGVLAGRRGTFNFVHGASTRGSDRAHEHGLIVPGSGTDELAGLEGAVRLEIEPDGTHWMIFDSTDP